ncbi:MAG: DNA polymerase III subunit beta [Firmicutes bacterium]|nr:DNA polymerase III subunit beta [Bacillota bacterium]
MHFQIRKSVLLSAINTVERATSPNNPKKVLAGIQLKADRKDLTLTANNLEIAIQTKIPCTAMKTGEAIVDGRLFSSLIRRLPDDNVIFELKDAQLLISAGNMEFTLYTIVDDLPEFPACEEQILALTDYELQRLINNSVFAVSTEEHQPIFSGVLLETTEEKLSFVATDSNRLSYVKAQTGEVLVSDLRLVVPSSSLNELVRCLPLAETLVEVFYGENQLVFQFEDTLFATRLIDGTFPNYEPVIFVDQETTLVLKRRQFLEALERASLFIRSENTPVIIQVKEGVLKIAVSTQLGKSSEQFNVEQKGKDEQAAYSPKFLLDMLTTTHAELVEFRFEGPRQALLKSVENEDHLYVLMPVRI